MSALSFTLGRFKEQNKQVNIYTRRVLKTSDGKIFLPDGQIPWFSLMTDSSLLRLSSAIDGCNFSTIEVEATGQDKGSSAPLTTQ